MFGVLTDDKRRTLAAEADHLRIRLYNLLSGENTEARSENLSDLSGKVESKKLPNTQTKTPKHKFWIKFSQSVSKDNRKMIHRLAYNSGELLHLPRFLPQVEFFQRCGSKM